MKIVITQILYKRKFFEKKQIKKTKNMKVMTDENLRMMLDNLIQTFVV